MLFNSQITPCCYASFLVCMQSYVFDGCYLKDGWMVSLTRWTWVSVNSGSLWWTGRPGVLQFMGLQRVGHDWVFEPNWTSQIVYFQTHIHMHFRNTCRCVVVPRVPGNRLTQKDNPDSEVQFIALAGPRQSLLLAKDPDWLLWKPYIP